MSLAYGQEDEGKPTLSNAASPLPDAAKVDPAPTLRTTGNVDPITTLPGTEREESEDTQWGIPPIRWNGVLGYTMRQNRSGDGSRTLDQLFSANVRGSSYIYAPWLASVSGDFGLVSSTNRTRGQDSGDEHQGQSASLIGGANLDLFPASNFPFSAYFNRSDSRTSSELLSIDSTNTRLGLRQTFQSAENGFNVSAGFDHSTIATLSSSSQHDTVNAFHSNFSSLIGTVSNSVGTTLSVSNREATGEAARLFTLSSSHAYRPQDNVSVAAFSNFTDNSLRQSGGAGLNESKGQFLQLGTTASWQPELEDADDNPLTISGGLNYAAIKSDFGSSGTESQRVGASTSAFYRYSPNLSINGSGAFNYYTTNNASAQSAMMLNSGVAYVGDPLEIGKFSYNWNTGANLAWQNTSGSMPSALFMGAQASHGLSRSFVLSAADSITMTLSQSAAVNQSQTTGSTTSLSHGVMGSYSLGLGEQFTGTLTSSLSDIVTNGQNSQHYQSLNVGLNGMGQLSSRSSAAVNLLLIWTDQTQKTAVEGQDSLTQTTQRMTITGNASYSHMRFAGIPGLRYSFTVTANSLLRDNRLMGDVNASAPTTLYSVDNRLDYHIGLLNLRLSGTVSDDVGGKKNALLFFQVTRQIGAF